MKNIFIVVICSWIPFSSLASETIYKCKNSAGKVEFKDTPCDEGTEQTNIKKAPPDISSPPGSGSVKMTTGKDNNFVKGSIEYMDHMKTCTPHTYVGELPIFGTVKNEIIGKKNGRCHIITTYTDSGTQVVCNYTDETIALLTSEQKYNEVKKGKFIGSSNSAEAARMSAECIAEN